MLPEPGLGLRHTLSPPRGPAFFLLTADLHSWLRQASWKVEDAVLGHEPRVTALSPGERQGHVLSCSSKFLEKALRLAQMCSACPLSLHPTLCPPNDLEVPLLLARFCYVCL